MKRVASLINLDYALSHQLTGRGIGIAIMDTGIGHHPDLTGSKSCLAGFYDTINNRPTFYDDNGHGTHVAGIIAGNGSACHGLYRGIAPGAHIYMIKVLNKNGEGNTENVIKGIDWILKHYIEYNIRIVNISVGSTKDKKFNEDSPLVKSVNKLWSAGLVVLTAAGNHGPAPYSIGAPGNSRKIITVGASEAKLYENSRDYSGRGPTDNCIKKPDIVAPGSNVTSCYPIELTSRYSPAYYRKNNKIEYHGNAPYLARSGTSMSTPVVSACIALLLEKNPSMSNKDVKLHLRNTAYNLGFPHSRQGWGMIKCDRLLDI